MPAPTALAGGQREALMRRRQHTHAVVREDHRVLNAYTAPAADVDARLDTEDHARLQRLLRGVLAQRRALVNLQPQPMADAIQILLAMSGGLRNLSPHPIPLLAR